MMPAYTKPIRAALVSSSFTLASVSTVVLLTGSVFVSHRSLEGPFRGVLETAPETRLHERRSLLDFLECVSSGP